MKLVQINICDNGSTGKIMKDIFSCMDEGVQKRAYVSRKYGNDSYVLKIHSKFGYRLHKFLSMYLGLDEWGSYFETKRIIRELKDFKPDIIHIHNIHNHTINYVLLFKYIKKYNVRTIWTLHDCWSFTGGCFHFELNNCMKWKTQCNHCRHLGSAGMNVPIDCTKKLYKIKEKTFTGVKHLKLVTPSKWLAGLVKQSFLKDYEINVINNGINPFNFHYTENISFKNLTKENKKIILGVAMPFTDKKGFSDFIALSKIIGEDYHIVLVGVSEEQRVALPDNITGIFRTDNQQQLSELYSLAYVFVNFTYEDTFSMVNLEALACSTPVICYNTGGATEMLEKENGIIVEQGDYSKIPSLLDFAGGLRENKNFFGEYILKKYSSEMMTKNYISVYNRIMNEKTGE